MKSTYGKVTCAIEPGDVKLTVFRTGKSVRLRDKTETALDSKTVKGVHSHFTYEIFFVTSGALQLVTEEGTTTYEGAVVIIPPRLRHYTVPKGDGCYCLLFSAEKALAPFRGGVCVLPLFEDAAFYIERIAQSFESASPRAAREAELLTELLFGRLMGDLLNTHDHSETKTSNSGHINEIEQYINGHIYEKITLGDVAGAVFLSPRQVSRIITATYGCSLSQLVNTKKLDAAQMLLRNTDMTVSEIAAQIGLGAENYFYRLFKSRFDISPLQYRKQKAGS